MFETVYHGVPIVTLPVFCDHDSNAAKAERDGYALKLELSEINAERLLWAIKKVIYDPKFKESVRTRQILLKDQQETPLQRALYWTEYVLRHRGASHLQSPARHLGVVQYYLLDVVLVIICLLYILYVILKLLLKIFIHCLNGNFVINFSRKDIKVE